MLTTSPAPQANTSEWVEAHEALSRLARERAAADAEEGRCLLAALRSAAHAHLGFGTFGEYVERLFGYKPRSTQEKLRVAEALEELPATAAALESGELNWSAVRELTRVAVPETEHEWLEVARGKTVHQLEALVAGRPRGERPDSPARPDARRHLLRFEVAAETLSLVREAMNKLRRDSGSIGSRNTGVGGSTFDDDSILMLMARHVLSGPSDERRASYQIALSVCPACRQGWQQASGELIPVGAEIVGMAECDGQHLGLLPVTANVHNAHVGARAKAEVETGTADEVESDTSDAHVGASSEREPQGRPKVAHTAARVKQNIPPATRRAVLHRDHHRCTVPGCRNARFLDLHHIDLSSEGGGNQASNLVTLCGSHHRAAHRGELLITGSVPEAVIFRHADGSVYGQPLEPRAIDVEAKAFGALRNLGFREGEVRRVLACLRANRRGPAPSAECIVREALAHLTAPRAH